MRVDKLLSNMGYGSRKEVKQLLKTGGVHVDGVVTKDGKTHIDVIGQVVTVFGEIVSYKPNIYLMMNKPQGVISATEDREHRTVIDLLLHEHAMYEPFPVGRLDKDTTGFLLLTNDGQFSHQLMSPRRHVPKMYVAEVSSEVSEREIELFRRGVTLDDGYVTKPATLVILENGVRPEVELTITEGKYHQVKRMFEAVGNKVTSLRRVTIGALQLDSELGLGEYRELTDDEYQLLIRKS